MVYSRHSEIAVVRKLAVKRTWVRE